MKQNSILHLNKKQIDKIQKSLIKNAIGPTSFRKDVPIAHGETKDGIMYNSKTTMVGTNGLVNNDGFFNNKSVDDKHFVEFLVAHFHEQRHLTLAMNAYENATGDESVDNALLVAYVAKDNQQYYLQNRTNFITEIDAEFYGILQAHDYIVEAFPDVDTKQIDKLFVDYVNEHITNYTYQIKKNQHKIETFDDVIDAFDQAYEDAITSRTRTYIRTRNNPDDVMELLRKPEYDDIFTKICEEKNPYEKDKMIASLTLHLHPEYVEKLPSLNRIDLSPTTVFGHELPMDKSEQRQLQAINILNIQENESEHQLY